jgi:DNA polymerase I-like protein with 3'-5' exonuclease and polymerase domains
MDLTHYRNSKEGYFKKYGLKDLLWFYLQIEISKEEQKSDWSGELTDAQKEYAMTDVRHLIDLYKTIQRNIDRKHMTTILKVEEMAIPAIMDANSNTLTIDLEKAAKLEAKYEEITKEEVNKYNVIITEVARELYDTDLDMIKAHRESKGQKVDCTEGKNKKDIAALTDKNGIFVSKSKGMFKFLMTQKLGKTVKSTDKTAVHKMVGEHPIFAQIETMTQLIKKYEDIQRLVHNRTGDDRVITKLNQIGTVTGRMSSSGLKDRVNGKDRKVGVNMQQINNADEFRDIFKAAEGKKLILADYSGMELRIVANIAGEETMLEAFRSNEDLHTKTASILFKQDYNEMITVLNDHSHPKFKEFKGLRNKSKSINFLITYGGGAKALSDGAGVTMDEAKNLIETYKTEVYPELATYIKQQNNSSTVFSALGRMINSDEVVSSGKYHAILNDEKFGWKAAKYVPRTNGLFSMGQYTNPVNFPIQSTGADIVKLALAFLVQHEDFIKDDIHIVHIVHDEIILEAADALCDKWEAILQEVMELAGNIVMNNNVYMEAEANVGTSWAEAK